MKPTRSNLAYFFDDVCVDVAAMRVTKGGRPVTLEPKAFDVLLHLLENPGVLVRKVQLLEALWPDIFVTENNLAHAVSQLRRVLGDSAKCARYIETVPRRGYRFIAPVVVEPRSVLSESTLLVTQPPPQVRASTIASVRNTFGAVDFLGTLAGRSWRTVLFPGAAWVALCAVVAAGALLLSGARGALVSTSAAGTAESVIAGSGTATAKAFQKLTS